MARSIYEQNAHKELLADGWIVDYKCRPRMVPRGYTVDFFGLFDLIAWKPGEKFIRWVAIKGVAGGRGALQKKILAADLPIGNRKEMWWIDSKGVLQKLILP